MMNLKEFKNSETGLNYLAYFGNWEDAYHCYSEDNK